MTPYDVAKLAEPPANGKAAIDAFFTSKGSTVYAILPRWPGREFTVKGVDSQQVKSVALLGGPAPLRWSKAAGGTSIQVPEVPPQLMSQPAWVLKIYTAGADSK